MRQRELRFVVMAAAMLVGIGGGALASAHPHRVTTGNGETVVIGHGQNHPGFVFNGETGLYESCEGIAPLPNEGPAGYGLETAHHGPDQGTPGKADGCFAIDGPATHPTQDRNPAID